MGFFFNRDKQNQLTKMYISSQSSRSKILKILTIKILSVIVDWLCGTIASYQVLHTLTDDGIGPDAPDKWMIMQDMSFLIAHIYKRLEVLLSINIG